MAIEIRRAARQKAWLKVAVTGVTGSGKTYSALMLAQGMAKRPLMIDTENGSGELYSHLMEYDYIRLAPPFTPAKFVEAIEAAVRNGNDFIIIDSLSHAWRYVLDYKDGLDSSNPRGSFSNWRKAKKLFDETMTALLQCPAHVCACMREKSEYTETVDQRGTKTMQKTGTQPIAEPDLEYEFAVCWKLDRAHQAVATKDRTEIWDVATPFTFSKRTGEQLQAWLDGGAGQLIRDPNWQASMLQDEETKALLTEADKVLAEAPQKEITYRDIVKAWEISENEWQDFRLFAEDLGYRAGDLLVKGHAKGCKSLADVYQKLEAARAKKSAPTTAKHVAPKVEPSEPEPEEDESPERKEHAGEAFGFKPARMPSALQHTKARSLAQVALLERKMAERDVTDDMAGPMLEAIAREFGCGDPGSSAAYSLTIEFLAGANEEQFDLAYAKADRIGR